MFSNFQYLDSLKNKYAKVFIKTNQFKVEVSLQDNIDLLKTVSLLACTRIITFRFAIGMYLEDSQLSVLHVVISQI